jgi:hypothetical protein
MNTLRNKLILSTIAGYLILNYGFMQLRIPPGSVGIPIGELVLLFCLATIDWARVLSRMSAIAHVLPFVGFWGLAAVRVVMGLSEYGAWAVRDASQPIESLFLLVGFAFAAREENAEKLFRWLPRVLLVISIYALGMPFAETLRNYSPQLTSMAGGSVPLLFSYTNTGQMLIIYAAYLTLSRPASLLRFKLSVLPIFWVLALGVGLVQSRTNYVHAIATAVLLFTYRPRQAGKWVGGGLAFLLIVSILASMGLQVQGRVGPISPEFMLQHLLTISGEAGDQELEAAASGASQRTGWWLDLYHRVTETPLRTLFGLGYGFPLIDFGLKGGIRVREPHNSLISVAARLGLIGFGLWAAMHVFLLRAWRQGMKICRNLQWRAEQTNLLLMMAFYIAVWSGCIGEDMLEKPFNCIPYYFFWGVTLRYVLHLKARAQEVESAEPVATTQMYAAPVSVSVPS